MPEVCFSISISTHTNTSIGILIIYPRLIHFNYHKLGGAFINLRRCAVACMHALKWLLSCRQRAVVYAVIELAYTQLELTRVCDATLY